MNERLPLDLPTYPSQGTLPSYSRPGPPASPPKGLLSKFLKLFAGILVIIVLFVIYQIVYSYYQNSHQQTVQLTYWGFWDRDLAQPMIDEFQKKNPTIRILYEKQDIVQYREKLMTRVLNGTGPDIFRFNNTWLPMYNSILTPLPNEVIGNSDFQRYYYPVAMHDLVKNGAIYGIPLEIDTLSLFVNTDLFKAAGLDYPKNWIDFQNDVRQFLVKDQSGKIKTSGASIGTFSNVDHAPDIISMLFIQNGVNITDFTQNTQNISDALNFYTSFALGEGSTWNDRLDPSTLAFANGNVAMYFGYSDDIGKIKKINPTLSFQVVPVPGLPGRAMTVANYWVEGISAKSTHQKEAFLFLNYLTQPTAQEILFQQSVNKTGVGKPYSRTDLSNQIKSDPLLSTSVSQAPNAYSTYFVGNTYDNGLNSELNKSLQNAINSILQSASPDDAVKTMAPQVMQVFNKYGVQ